MDTEESKKTPIRERIERCICGLGLHGFCVGLDVFLHNMDIVDKGYSHPHGFGALRQLLGWLGGWIIGWMLMRWFVSFWGRRFGPKNFGHAKRSGIWAGFALFVMLALPTDY
jgi:hypothetical protein